LLVSWLLLLLPLLLPVLLSTGHQNQAALLLLLLLMLLLLLLPGRSYFVYNLTLERTQTTNKQRTKSKKKNTARVDYKNLGIFVCAIKKQLVNYKNFNYDN